MKMPATAHEIYKLAEHLGPVDAAILRSAADELERLRKLVDDAARSTAGRPESTEADQHDTHGQRHP